MKSTPLRVTDAVSIPAGELSLRFARAGGPGGQNVNKVASKVELLFDVGQSRSLNASQRDRILSALAPRIDSTGVLHVVVDSSRSQWANREEALEHLAGLLARALRPIKRRIAGRPTGSSRRRRITVKKERGGIKTLRRRVQPDD
jgi:ribosome-associated protein